MASLNRQSMDRSGRWHPWSQNHAGTWTPPEAVPNPLAVRNYITARDYSSTSSRERVICAKTTPPDASDFQCEKIVALGSPWDQAKALVTSHPPDRILLQKVRLYGEEEAPGDILKLLKEGGFPEPNLKYQNPLSTITDDVGYLAKQAWGRAAIALTICRYDIDRSPAWHSVQDFGRDLKKKLRQGLRKGAKALDL